VDRSWKEEGGGRGKRPRKKRIVDKKSREDKKGKCGSHAPIPEKKKQCGIRKKKKKNQPCPGERSTKGKTIKLA